MILSSFIFSLFLVDFPLFLAQIARYYRFENEKIILKIALKIWTNKI